MAKTTMHRSQTDAEEQSKRAEANYLISPSKLTYMLEADLLDPLRGGLGSREPVDMLLLATKGHYRDQ